MHLDNGLAAPCMGGGAWHQCTVLAGWEGAWPSTVTIWGQGRGKERVSECATCE